MEEESGIRIRLVEADQSEFTKAVDSNQPLIESLRADVRTVFGTELRARLGRQN